jgi:hypothetical protein
MLISDNIYWLVANWPTPGTAASTYAVFAGASPTPISGLSAVGNTQALVTYDDTVGQLFLVRPTQTVLSVTTYGPAQAIAVGPLSLTTRGSIRSYVRKAMSDRTDTGDDATRQPKVADGEINEYLNDAIRRYSLLFPRQSLWNVPIQQAVRSYPIPADFLKVQEAKYTATNAGSYIYYLKEEPYSPGETTADSFVGITKLGILTQVQSGRYYRGHYWVENGQLTIDFDPDITDQLAITYAALHMQPTDDTTTLDVLEPVVEGLTLYVQAKGWLQIESSDVSLSRWDRGASGNARRDDMPTEKMSTRMFNAWTQWLETQRSARPRAMRLYRRT